MDSKSSNSTTASIRYKVPIKIPLQPSNTKPDSKFPKLVPLVQNLLEQERQSSMSNEENKKLNHLKSLLPGLQSGEYRKLLENAGWDLMQAVNNYTAIPIKQAKSSRNVLKRNTRSISNFRTDLAELTNKMDAWSPLFMRKTLGDVKKGI